METPVFDTHYEFTIETLPERQVERTSLFLEVVDAAGPPLAVVLDSERDEFVRVPALPEDRYRRLLALSPDGTGLLFRAEHFGCRDHGLCLHTLATGQQRWFDAHADGEDEFAALSPDGRTIATLSLARDPQRPDDWQASLAVVSVIEVATGHRRRVWERPGSWVAESTISWSPDGQLVAATYFTTDERHAIVVVDTAGAVVAHQADVYTLPSPNGAWIADRELVYCWDAHDEDLAATICNVLDGTHHALGLKGYPCAMIGDRFVTRPVAGNDPVRLYTIGADGNDPQPLVILHPPRNIALVDTARRP